MGIGFKLMFSKHQGGHIKMRFQIHKQLLNPSATLLKYYLLSAGYTKTLMKAVYETQTHKKRSW